MTSRNYFNQKIKSIKPNLSLLSHNQYVSVLENLYPNVSNDNQLETELSKDNIHKIVSEIEEKYTSCSSKGFKYNVIIALVKNMYGTEDSRYTFLSKKRDECNEKYIKKAENGLTEKDKSKMVSHDEYQKMLTEWKDEIIKLMNKEKITRNDFMEIQSYYLCLIYYYYGFRVDITPMDIIFKKKLPDTNKNFLHVFNKKYTFVLRQYKTEKSYGEKQIIIEDRDLINELSQYIKFLEKYNDRKEGLRLFSTKSNSDYLSQSALSTLFTLVFKSRLNKPFTFTLNRKRIVSEDPDVQEYTVLKEKVSKLADEMGHSLSMQEEIYNVNKQGKTKVKNLKK